MNYAKSKIDRNFVKKRKTVTNRRETVTNRRENVANRRENVTNRRETVTNRRETTLTNWYIALLACAIIVIAAGSKLDVVYSSCRPAPHVGVNLCILQISLNFQVDVTLESKIITEENSHQSTGVDEVLVKNDKIRNYRGKANRSMRRTLKVKPVQEHNTSDMQSSPSWLHGSEGIRVFSKYTKTLKTSQHKDHAVRVGQPFIVFEEGHQLVMTLCPSGCDDGAGSHLSVYLHLMKGPHDDELEQAGQWPLRGVFRIELLNQFADQYHHAVYLTMDENVCKNCSSKIHLEDKLGHPFGRSQFYPLSNLNNSIYLQNDSLYFRVLYQRYYYNFSLATSLSEIYFAFEISIYNWLAVSLLLVLTKLTLTFCLKETKLDHNIIDHHLPFGKVRHVLLAECQPMAHTCWTIFCKAFKNFLLLTTLVILGLVLLVATELMYSDMSTVEDRYEFILTMLRRVSQVLTWSMTVETYETFWGGSFIMISPVWIIHLL